MKYIVEGIIVFAIAMVVFFGTLIFMQGPVQKEEPLWYPPMVFSGVMIEGGVHVETDVQEIIAIDYHEKKQVVETVDVEETPVLADEVHYNVHHKIFPEGSIEQTYIDYAYMISDYDKDFVLMLNAENTSRDPGRYGDGGGAKGFCQFNRRWYAHIVDDPRFDDWKRQLETCLQYYRSGTRFYGYDSRMSKARMIDFR